MRPALGLALALLAAAAIAAPCGDVSCWPARPENVDPSWIYCSSMFGRTWASEADCAAVRGSCVSCTAPTPTPTPSPSPTPGPTPPPFGTITPAPIAVLSYFSKDLIPAPYKQDADGYLRFARLDGDSSREWFAEMWLLDPLKPKQPIRYRIVKSPDQRPLP